MEANDDDKKKINDDVIVFLRKGSGTEAPRYAARLKTYVDLQYKRRRAAAAKRNSESALRNGKNAASLKKDDVEPTTGEVTEQRAEEVDHGSQRRGGDKGVKRSPRSRSAEPTDGCCRRRRKRSCGRKRRRRSRRRRSCRRRSRRRRRRSCSRRRRRRSCRRRMMRRRRRRC